MTLSTETKKGILVLAGSLALSALVIYLIRRDSKESYDDRPAITEETMMVAYKAYKDAKDAGEPPENLKEVNEELKKEFGLTVEYKSIKDKFYIYDSDGKKIKEV